MADTTVPASVPTSLRRLDEARTRFGSFAATYLDAMHDGDPLADAFVAEFDSLGHGRAMRMLRTACREGIDAVPDAPASLRDLFAQLDATPDWVDTARLDHDSRFVSRYTRQAGIVLGAASLVSGYANSAASRPLEMTGRYVEDAGARTVEVASWLIAVNEPGGLERLSPGFELTVRVRVIHALVRADLTRRPDWDGAAWGVPICQAYLAYTLVEFALIPLRASRDIGAPYLPHEEAASYARWRYLGHLLGIDETLLPRDRAEQERLEAVYLMTRPPVDDFCRRLVASINADFLVAEIEGITPRPLHRWAPTAVHALERVFLGDEIADELAIPRTRLVGVVRRVGPALGLVNTALDRASVTLAPRARLGRRYQERQDARLRRDWGVRHDLVDASPGGGRPHPARGDTVDGPAQSSSSESRPRSIA
ncbi:oxygenase MpaB family protein [Nocardioides sp.]|uniref:oxygenase MpaB family protein n=1 Tax=Nocardioides sp. TaxID=35761 RepID=UPI002719B9E9|nr:oxygenase MpaB family protein [Nocardioides sp.]MDO9455057.1 oxygenase MpaB family protein [Nocardioides sp.]